MLQSERGDLGAGRICGLGLLNELFDWNAGLVAQLCSLRKRWRAVASFVSRQGGLAKAEHFGCCLLAKTKPLTPDFERVDTIVHDAWLP